MSAAIVHPRFMASIPAGFFPLQATVQGKTVTQDAYGQEVETWASVAGLVSISAAKAPLTAMERQGAGYTATDVAWHVLLKGAYPTITTRHRLVIGAETFDIDASETDQMGVVTRLRVRQVGV